MGSGQRAAVSPFRQPRPFYLAAGAVVAAIAVLAAGHSVLTRAERDAAAELGVPATAPAAARWRRGGGDRMQPRPGLRAGSPGGRERRDGGAERGAAEASITAALAVREQD